jgi:hypothetical protein
LNSTLKSLLFWMVLVVIGVLIWNFSTTFQRGPSPIAFTTFLGHVEKNQVIAVTITGNEITGELSSDTGNGKEQFRTYVPGTHYEDWPTNSRKKTSSSRRNQRRPVLGPHCCTRGRPSC